MADLLKSITISVTIDPNKDPYLLHDFCAMRGYYDADDSPLFDMTEAEFAQNDLTSFVVDHAKGWRRLQAVKAAEETEKVADVAMLSAVSILAEKVPISEAVAPLDAIS